MEVPGLLRRSGGDDLLLRRAALLAALAAAACTGSTSTKNARPRLESDARRAVAGLAASYERAHAEDFFERVDQSAMPDFPKFQDDVRRFLLRKHSLNLDVIIDAVVVNDDEAAVTARWNKAYVDEDGHPQKEDGACELLLKARPSGGLALVLVRGDSPF